MGDEDAIEQAETSLTACPRRERLSIVYRFDVESADFIANLYSARNMELHLNFLHIPS